MNCKFSTSGERLIGSEGGGNVRSIGLSPPDAALNGCWRKMLAGSTGLEPAASAVTGQRSSQLNYDP
jgi:hypothetical protein